MRVIDKVFVPVVPEAAFDRYAHDRFNPSDRLTVTGPLYVLLQAHGQTV